MAYDYKYFFFASKLVQLYFSENLFETFLFFFYSNRDPKLKFN